MSRNYLVASVASFLLSNAALAAAPTLPISSGQDSITTGHVTIGHATVPYRAIAGNLLVHEHKYDDSQHVIEENTGEKLGKNQSKENDDIHDAVASMFYVAYVKEGVKSANRPITFVYNGGPGSASVWLHMGSFGPVRLDTPGDFHLPAAPYKLINNNQSLLDVTDLVFVDAPGTGFGRIAGQDHEKAFYGVDEDGHAFTRFIAQFLAKYNRYNSPKYLLGESYGTMRSAVVINDLQDDENIDFNGVILLSQILNYENNIDAPRANPGIDEPYELALPSYAATAWYHNVLPHKPTDLPKFLAEVEQFAITDYTMALHQGADLPQAQRQAIAEKLHGYTGLSVDYLLQGDLRITGGQFSKHLQQATGMTTGRLDSRFSGPSLNLMSEEAGYDPQSTAISSAYISAFNDYARTVLHYGDSQRYLGGIDPTWNYRHKQPGMGTSDLGANVMPDLANAMKTNPQLHVMLNAGYYDLATPFYEGIYEMKHLPIPPNLQKNIEYKQYFSGHMVYVDPASLQELHDNMANFINRTHN
ncbi:S10 family peptidase [Kozakia baliensis]|uniref:S10 family peptidase n=1 Tax=Kozakia baliensis TaxID=153496 RepID=UPI0038D0DE49